jgi:NADPH:quinone reductase-like Zn-dependent oxidoreductase
MSDGAGIVEAVGTGVSDFAVGDQVVSTFFPDWLQGDAPLATFARTPGDGLDGYGVEIVARPAFAIN